MAKKFYLLPFAAALSALALAADAKAPIPDQSVPAMDGVGHALSEAARGITSGSSFREGGGLEVVYPSGEDLFRFVIRRAGDGQIFADHESHYSHQSHSSHRSHYSSSQ